MGQGRSIQLARVFGIRIGADVSWFVVLFLLIWGLSTQYKSEFPGHDTRAFVLAALTAAAFAGSIALHELGHAIVARRNGIRVLGIDLWLFGGLTRMERDPASPGAELAIAAAGPAMTAVVAAVAIALSPHGFADAFNGNYAISPAGAVFGYLAWINCLVLVVNLVPGMPLDGGRITRAIAWWRTGDLGRANTITATIGRGAGYLLGAAGAYVLFRTASLTIGIWLMFVAFLLVQSARQVDIRGQVAERLGNLRVADVMDAQPVALPAHTKLDRALDEFFLRYGWDWFPVVDAMGRFLGLVSRERVEEVPEALRPGSSVDEVTSMDTGSVYRVGIEEPLERLLGSQGLVNLGALMAVDGDGVLRGVVTIEQVKRALQPPVRTA